MKNLKCNNKKQTWWFYPQLRSLILDLRTRLYPAFAVWSKAKTDWTRLNHTIRVLPDLTVLSFYLFKSSYLGLYKCKWRIRHCEGYWGREGLHHLTLKHLVCKSLNICSLGLRCQGLCICAFKWLTIFVINANEAALLHVDCWWPALHANLLKTPKVTWPLEDGRLGNKNSLNSNRF